MKNIALIFGGEATEREVSIVTAYQIEKMCDRKKYNLMCVLIDENKKMFWCKKGIDVKQCAKPQPCSKDYEEIVFAAGAVWKTGGRRLKKICNVDLALVACHGGSGENGELVAKLNLDGIKTSVGVPEALGIAMDKAVAKCVLEKSGICVVEGLCIFEKDWKENKKRIFELIQDFGYPVIVKPARQGSSVGIGIAKCEDELEAVVNLALEFDNKILVERALIDFKEYNVSVLKSEKEFLISGIEEAFKSGDFLSFEDKYFGGAKNSGLQKFAPKSSKMSGFDAFARQKSCKMQSFGMENMDRQMVKNLASEVADKIFEYAKKSVEVLELYGVVRIDFLVDSSGTVYLNEINAVPGSLAFYFWRGFDFFDRLVDAGLCGVGKKKGSVAKFL